MKSRYGRCLIENEEQLEESIQNINSLMVTGEIGRILTFRRKEIGFNLEVIERSISRTSLLCYEKEGVDACLKCFKHKKSIFLRGHFDTLPPKAIVFENQRESLKNLIQFMLLKHK